ncbi:hypothetical protein CTheo_7461 [Ceratobasidium theobromae]|uniref:Uncharacterized protein n=1 Tax=Ceratobasidium theobromae TaxID=1582974 RepID=A0A5N5QBT5_9AGAM|nr:hypothetical protein CTheo_7461 [Ceratobasidium theobromae]
MEEPEACVSIPASMANNREIPFPCPSCASEHRLHSIGYFINRGARTTMRVASRASVALVIYHLNSHAAAARTLADQITSSMQVFFVNVAWQTRLIHHGIRSHEAEAFFDELPRSAPYHLAVIFLTEGDPQGGWWHTSMHGNQHDCRVSETQFLESCLRSLNRFATQALTARIFGVACGFNLKVKGSLGLIEIFCPQNSIPIPLIAGNCIATFVRVSSNTSRNFRQPILFWQPPRADPPSSLGKINGRPVELQVGIHPGPRRQIKDLDATFTEERWDPSTKSFRFNEAANVRIKLLPPHPEGKPWPLDLDQLWTRSGKQAVKDQNLAMIQ